MPRRSRRRPASRSRPAARWPRRSGRRARPPPSWRSRGDGCRSRAAWRSRRARTARSTGCGAGDLPAARAGSWSRRAPPVPPARPCRCPRSSSPRRGRAAVRAAPHTARSACLGTPCLACGVSRLPDRAIDRREIVEPEQLAAAATRHRDGQHPRQVAHGLSYPESWARHGYSISHCKQSDPRRLSPAFAGIRTAPPSS